MHRCSLTSNSASHYGGNKADMKNCISLCGFTWIEIIIVLFILILLAGFIVPRHTLGDGTLTSKEARLKRKEVKTQMKEIMMALEYYRQDNGNYPTALQGLQALVEKPTIDPKPKAWRQHLDKVPFDPWGYEFIYKCPGANHGMKLNNRMGGADYDSFDLISYGPDGVEGDDDIVSWNLPDE